VDRFPETKLKAKRDFRHSAGRLPNVDCEQGLRQRSECFDSRTPRNRGAMISPTRHTLVL